MSKKLENLDELKIVIYYLDVINVESEFDKKIQKDLKDASLDLDLISKYIVCYKVLWWSKRKNIF